MSEQDLLHYLNPHSDSYVPLKLLRFYNLLVRILFLSFNHKL